MPAARWAAAVLAACLFVPACTSKQYASQADKAAYGLIGEKQLMALGQKPHFTIDYNPFPAGVRPKQPTMLLKGEPIPLGTGTPRKLSLEDCLLVAARNSRSFQTEKEDLYVEALALANMRNDWSLVDGSLTAEGERVGNVGRNTSTWAGAGAAELSFTQQLATGGALALAMGLDFTTSFLDIRETTFGSMIDLNFTQPLLRGAWRGFAYEDLYRAERDLAIAVLSYRRFTQTFGVDIAVAYYQVLQQRDRLAIEQQSLRNFEQTYKFVKAQVDGGMLSRVQADQAEQNVLSAQSRVEGARQTYENRLDGFKLTLGIPIAANIELDQAELAKLTPLAIPFDLPTSEGTALRTRPDVLTSYAALRDRKRDVEIAADAFNPQLDVMLAVSVTGRQPRQPFKLQTHHPTYTAGLDFSYPLNQVDNRDAYRNALISEQRARRDLDEFLDTVRQEVRTSYRSLLASKRNHEIQTAAVKLAVRRLKLVRVEQKEGLANTRDVLDAEDAWRNSRNALTAALVNYVTTRLRFLATLGMISVDEQGRSHERKQPEYIDRFRGDAPPAR